MEYLVLMVRDVSTFGSNGYEAHRATEVLNQYAEKGWRVVSSTSTATQGVAFTMARSLDQA